MLRSNGWGGAAFLKRAIPCWKRVLESNPRMGTGRLLRACVVVLALLAAAGSARPALAQANFDRPGGDYLSSPVISGDPAECALVCERDRRCRAWTFSYPTDLVKGAVCWLKSNVPARVQSDCCVSGVRGAGVVERRNDAIETSIDRFGGDYKSFDLKSSDGGDDACKAACAADNKCRAWTYARPGYAGKDAHCFLKKDIKPPRRKAGYTSGVVR
jgi:PAN domain-containing protein